jgi:hypothetical protein
MHMSAQPTVEREQQAGWEPCFAFQIELDMLVRAN